MPATWCLNGGLSNYPVKINKNLITFIDFFFIFLFFSVFIIVHRCKHIRNFLVPMFQENLLCFGEPLSFAPWTVAQLQTLNIMWLLS